MSDSQFDLYACDGDKEQSLHRPERIKLYEPNDFPNTNRPQNGMEDIWRRGPLKVVYLTLGLTLVILYRESARNP